MQVEIEINDEMIDRAIRGALRRRHYDVDTDEEYFENVDLDDVVRKQLKKLIDKKIDALAKTAVSDAIADGVRRVCDEGFAMTNAYGEPTGDTTTLRSVVAGFLVKKSNSNYNSDYGDMLSSIRKIRDEEIKKQVTAAVKAEAEGISAALKAAGAEALTKFMAKAIGR